MANVSLWVKFVNNQVVIRGHNLQEPASHRGLQLLIRTIFERRNENLLPGVVKGVTKKNHGINIKFIIISLFLLPLSVGGLIGWDVFFPLSFFFFLRLLAYCAKEAAFPVSAKMKWQMTGFTMAATQLRDTTITIFAQVIGSHKFLPCLIKALYGL